MAGAAGAEVVRAAGAVLWRPAGTGRAGRIEIALVHRPRYDDWSHPKGKLGPGESHAEAALREVREETGMECVLGAELPGTGYRVGGRAKRVRYWTAEAVAGAFARNDEVDRLVWFAPGAARAALTHDRDRPLVDAALRALDAGR